VLDLVDLGPGVYAFLHPRPRFGDTNVGLVVDGDGLTLIDTTATPDRATDLERMVRDFTGELGLPLRRVVLTSSRIPFSGGSEVFRLAAFYGSEATSEQLDAPVNLTAIRALLPHLAGSYTEEFTTRPITHTVDTPAWLTSAALGVPLPGESPSTLVVQVPGVDAVFAGAACTFGVTPLAFDADLEAWAAGLDELNGLGRTVVPGHGSVGGRADVADLRDYLQACVEADGRPERLASGPWDRWTNPEFHPVNIERAARLARGDDSVPTSLLELLGLA
jgi:glyoxylase-like metal-dependent hydrolase (beta-lactamase superfamily II)